MGSLNLLNYAVFTEIARKDERDPKKSRARHRRECNDVIFNPGPEYYVIQRMVAVKKAIGHNSSFQGHKTYF